MGNGALPDKQLSPIGLGDLNTTVPLEMVAAARGSDDAKRYRLELSGEMSKPEIAEAQRRAREWLSKH